MVTLLRVTKYELSVQGYLEEGRERGRERERRKSLIINITHQILEKKLRNLHVRH